MDTERNDLVVVGTGVFGLSAAVTYQQIHPDATLLVLEASPTIGGTWAPHRTFPGLKTNNLFGTYEYPDFPMEEKRFGVEKGKHIGAENLYQYFEAFAEDKGINPYIRLNTIVEAAEKVDGGWKLHCRSTTGDGASYTVQTAKLILSTGLANRPYMPKYPTSPEFNAPIIHSAEFPARLSTIAKPSTHTLIIGAGKSAWDIAYSCATQPDSTVTMLVRPSGKGPMWMAPAFVTPLKLQLEKLVFTRFFGFMSPCPWTSSTGFEGLARWFLQQTWLGRKLVAAFWNIMGEDVVSLNKYNEHPETKKLRPCILNYPTDFFDLVRNGKVQVKIGEIESFGEGKDVLFTDGEKVKFDAVVCATGWETSPSVKFLPPGIDRELGLPRADPTLDGEEKELLHRSEAELYSRYPFLKERNSNRLYHPDPSHRLSPKEAEADKTQNPYRLFRFLVPISDLQERSIGFVGAMQTLGTASCAYIQGLWLTAYLDGSLPLASPKSPSDIKYETYLETQYCAIRHAMGNGNQFPDLVFDALPYFDILLRDLGLTAKRKGGFRAEYFSPYGPPDYRGLIDQWKRQEIEKKSKTD